MMEYIIITLPATRGNAEELLGIYAEKGWMVICSLTDYRLILGREKVVEKEN